MYHLALLFYTILLVLSMPPEASSLSLQKTSVSAHCTNVLPKISEVELTGDVRDTAPKQLVKIRQPDSSLVLLAPLSLTVPTLLVTPWQLKTGNLPEIRTMPFAAELFVKDGWTGLPPIPEGDQAQTMPDA